MDQYHRPLLPTAPERRGDKISPTGLAWPGLVRSGYGLPACPHDIQLTIALAMVLALTVYADMDNK